MTSLPSPRPHAAPPVRPERASASGPVPYRAVVLGVGTIAGADRPGFVDGFAQALAVRTGHGVDVDAIDGLPLAGAATEGVLVGHDLTHLDALVLVLDPARPTAATQDALRSLAAGLEQRLTVGAALVVVVPPGRADGFTARDRDRLATTARDTLGALVPVVRLEELPGSTGEGRLAQWADAISEATATALIDPMVRFQPNDPFDEFDRVEAVGRIGRRYADWVGTFQDVVESARSTYGTRSAAMSIIDDETTRYFTRSGNVATALPRGKTVCNRVMRIYGGLILGDARLDTRFSGLPEVRTGDVRFYAGYRITGPDGEPFGALCVFDSEPRDVADEDLTDLRDLALDAQRRLWSLLDAPVA